MTRMVALGWALSAFLISTARADDGPSLGGDAQAPTAQPAAAAQADAAPAQKHLLRYKFKPGETLRWKVTHRARVNTTVSGTTQTAETTSTSIKVWRILPASAKTAGQKDAFRFEHLVESVEMRQKLTGREEVVYDSTKNEEAPPGFEDAAKAVGVPLAIIAIDAQGNVVSREQKAQRQNDAQGQITLPLPAEAIAVGHVWSFPYEVPVPLKSGEVKQIKTRQRFALEEVKDGIATISVETQILTPVQNPEVEAQLIQRETAGKVKFDIAAGRIVDQQMDLDKSVVGFSGDTSSLHYVTRFTEELLPAKAVAGPAAPKKATAPAASAAKKQPASRAAAKPAPRQAARPQPRATSPGKPATRK